VNAAFSEDSVIAGIEIVMVDIVCFGSWVHLACSG